MMAEFAQSTHGTGGRPKTLSTAQAGIEFQQKLGIVGEGCWPGELRWQPGYPFVDAGIGTDAAGHSLHPARNRSIRQCNKVLI